MAICAYICVSKIGVYVDAGKGTALPVLVCVRGNDSIKCVCVCLCLAAGQTCRWEDQQLHSLGWDGRNLLGLRAHSV